MGLKNDFFGGTAGLQAQVKAAFEAGIAFVGSSVEEDSNLDLTGANGAALTQASAPGLYWDVSSPSIDYRVWYYVATELQPATGGRTLVQVVVLGSDSAAQVAVKTAAALNAISGTPFTATATADAIDILNNVAGPAKTAPDTGTLPGTTSITVETAGVAPTGNYTTIQAALQANAAQGLTCFTVTIVTNFNNAFLRTNKGHNQINKAYFAGIQYALAGEDIYNYECFARLNVSDNTTTSVDLNFQFGGVQGGCGCGGSNPNSRGFTSAPCPNPSVCPQNNW